VLHGGQGSVGSVAVASDDQPLFERVDGVEFFVRLVDRFYAGVMADEVLAPLYPPDDVEGARARLTWFLVQYWGGPATYSDHRGHPRLRMRHAPFAVGEAERVAWMRHMGAAVAAMEEEGAIGPDDRDRLLAYFDTAARHMVNVAG
jgi:hemoglobin